MSGLKQEGLAYELGEDWNQKKVSLLEQKEVVDDALQIFIESKKRLFYGSLPKNEKH